MKYDNGESYDESTKGPYYHLWFQIMEHYLEIYLPETGRVLDAGGGTGEFSLRTAALRQAISIVNLDASSAMLDRARWKVKEQELADRIRCMPGDVHSMPFEDGAFDYVMCFGDVLSFCKEPKRAFAELGRVTAKKGQLHLSVNSFWGNFHFMMGQGGDQFSFKDARDYYRTKVLHTNGESTGCRSFTLSELKGYAGDCNLSIRKIFAAPVFPAANDWLKDDRIAEEIKELQYRHCEDENLLELGNHINVIYEK